MVDVLGYQRVCGFVRFVGLIKKTLSRCVCQVNRGSLAHVRSKALVMLLLCRVTPTLRVAVLRGRLILSLLSVARIRHRLHRCVKDDASFQVLENHVRTAALFLPSPSLEPFV
jgi:hypothetical protein